MKRGGDEARVGFLSLCFIWWWDCDGFEMTRERSLSFFLS